MLDITDVLILESVSSASQVIDLLSNQLAINLDISPKIITEGVLEREKRRSTVFNGSVIPHCRLHVSDFSIVVCVTDKPFKWLDDAEVDLVIMFVSPHDKHVEHLQLLANICRSMKELRKQSKTQQAIYEFLQRNI